MKKFSEFLPKTILADTDFLVGYNADGEYIRVPKSALLAGAATPATLTVQYSANSESWHDNYTAGDRHVRIKAGSGAWSTAIPICVSAYDIWIQQGHRGDKDDFLLSLKGEPGAPADVSGLNIQNMPGYAAFELWAANVINTAKNALAAEVTQAVTTAIASTLANKLDKNLSNLEAVTYMGKSAKLLVITSDGALRTVSAADVAAYTNIINRTENSSLEVALKTQRKSIECTPDQTNTKEFTISGSSYMPGTSAVYLNGVRMYAGVDYKETQTGFEFLTYTPTVNDNIIFEAVQLDSRQ